MISLNANNDYTRVMLSSLNHTLSDKQRQSLNKRLQMSNVDPVAIYKHNKYNTIVLSCINTNLQVGEPFYFLYWDNGAEHGRGYDFMKNNDSYILIINLKESKEVV